VDGEDFFQLSSLLLEVVLKVNFEIITGKKSLDFPYDQHLLPCPNLS